MSDDLPEPSRPASFLDFDTMRGVLTAICWRPHVYTRDGSFSSVVAFLDGFACGQSPHGMGSIGVGHHGSEFGRFREWLEARCRAVHPDTPPVLQWWAYLLRLHPDEAGALRHLPALYEGFLAQDGADAGAA